MADRLVQRDIIQAVLSLDDSIIKPAIDVVHSKESLLEEMKKLAPAYAGSCALSSIYDSAARTLHVACTGDSRAELGQKRSDGKWEALPLSVDQTDSNEEVIVKIYSEDPGEEVIIKDGRGPGLMISKAFGNT